MIKRVCVSLTVTAWTLGGALAQTTRPAAATRPAATGPAGAGTAAAVLIAGLGGSKDYSRNLLDWTNRFHAVLVDRCGLKGERIAVLTEKADPKATPARVQSTRENIRSAMKKMSALLTPDDQFILFTVGHGQLNEPTGKLCLPGRDIDADELGELLEALPTRKIVIVNGASGGAEFLKSCIAYDRVIITGAGAGGDGNQTYFTEFFLRGYETREADMDGNKLIDLLEAYAYSARWTANFYHRQYMGPVVRQRRRRRDPGQPAPPARQVWLVHGKETRKIWKRLYAGSRHTMDIPERARESIQIPLPDPNLPDLEPKWGKWDVHWHKRRYLVEHARLDDCADKQGFFLWEPYQFKKLPEDDEPGTPGYLSRRTVLGRPEPLKLPAK